MHTNLKNRELVSNEEKEAYTFDSTQLLLIKKKRRERERLNRFCDIKYVEIQFEIVREVRSRSFSRENSARCGTQGAAEIKAAKFAKGR